IRRDTTPEALAGLPPVFDRKYGTVTAGNSSPLTDGAAAVLLMSEARAREEGVEPLAFVRTWAVAAVDPGGQLLMGPALAAPRAPWASRWCSSDDRAPRRPEGHRPHPLHPRPILRDAARRPRGRRGEGRGAAPRRPDPGAASGRRGE